MIALYHFLLLAIHNLWRGGQRVLVALLCIAFGVMALVAMNMLAKSIQTAVDMPPAQLIGGDISMGRQAEDHIRSEDITQIESLRQSGQISRYTLIAFNSSSIVFHTAGTGEMHFALTGMGIEPLKYPLAGSLAIGEPRSVGLPTLLQRVGDLVVTRDIAERYNLKVGDPIILADLRVGVPVSGTLRGIAYDTPNHQGEKIYYSIETARKLANGLPVVNTVILNASHNAPHPESIRAKLEGSGWSVDWMAGREANRTSNLWMIGLRGAGILGLLVGGIGIANTMQVLLRRRQREIAIWKTLGYHPGDLRLIFMLEAGLLGLTGSLLGAGLGALVSTGLLELFLRTSTMLYQWTFSPIPPLLGLLVGTLTALVFATWAIVMTGQARPAALLRDELIDVQGLPGCQSLLLGLLLAVPFTALASLVMESLVAGIGVLISILIGIGVLGGLFSAMLWVCTRFFSVRGFPLVGMAFNNLNRHRITLVFAMIALFVGVLSMSLGLAVTRISQRRISSGSVDFQGYNLEVLAMAGQEEAIRQVIQAQDPEKVGLGYRTALDGLSVAGEPIAAMDATLVGRSDPGDYVISRAEWGSQDSNTKNATKIQIPF